MDAERKIRASLTLGRSTFLPFLAKATLEPLFSLPRGRGLIKICSGYKMVEKWHLYGKENGAIKSITSW